ncbi:hypothetical protein [Cupriavidus pauculus]|uniref:hypothetical protein n=1 Tax=Cupriavidus pauculus TaxID=82633 RepID=UPI001CBB4BF0|nr:hypothetical protein [Cupriavidus pauculus]
MIEISLQFITEEVIESIRLVDEIGKPKFVLLLRERKLPVGQHGIDAEYCEGERPDAPIARGWRQRDHAP